MRVLEFKVWKKIPLDQYARHALVKLDPKQSHNQNVLSRNFQQWVERRHTLKSIRVALGGPASIGYHDKVYILLAEAMIST